MVNPWEFALWGMPTHVGILISRIKDPQVMELARVSFLVMCTLISVLAIGYIFNVIDDLWKSYEWADPRKREWAWAKILAGFCMFYIIGILDGLSWIVEKMMHTV